jgi:glycosyltransferase involved in cell wall biosynthesis
MNMDGIEWKLDKWSFPQKIWLLLNEFLGARLSTHLVADHPEIARHLQRHTSKRKITTIAYGADELPPAGDATVEECSVLAKLGILPRGYMIVIARPEPENSLLEIVQAFSRQPRNVKLVVLGRLAPESNPYHRRVMETAGTNVLFPGAIFDKTIVGTLRRFACAYIHGHTVGGTNPSLVEALAAGSAVIAKDTAFNRWVAGPRAAYFDSVPQLSDLITDLLLDSDRLDSMRNASYIRFREAFRQEEILGKYMTLLEKFDSPPRYSEAREVLFQPTRLED